MWRATTLALVCLLLALQESAATGRSLKPQDAPIPTGGAGLPQLPPTTLLYVWAGAYDPSRAKDAIITLHADSTNPATYGKVASLVETPFNNLEAHHCKVTADRKYLGASALLGAVYGHPSVLFFDLADPARPVYLPGKAQPAHGANADEFQPMPDGGFLVTMMGSASGFTPGRLVRYNASLDLVGEYPTLEQQGQDLKDHLGFNPHGVAVDFIHRTMATTDYVEPASTLTAVPGGVVARTTLRLWDLDELRMKAVVQLEQFGAAGVMDVHAIGTTGQYYTSGGNFLLYHIAKPSWKAGCGVGECEAPEATPVFNFRTGQTPYSSCLLKVFRNGTRLLITVFAESRVVLLDTSNPKKPKLLSSIQMPEGAGGHLVAINSDESVAAVATYFIDGGETSRLRMPGDCTVRFFALYDDATVLAPHPRAQPVDFMTLFPEKGAYKPHGIAFF